jgi:hypothetical protein
MREELGKGGGSREEKNLFVPLNVWLGELEGFHLLEEVGLELRKDALELFEVRFLGHDCFYAVQDGQPDVN